MYIVIIEIILHTCCPNSRMLSVLVYLILMCVVCMCDWLLWVSLFETSSPIRYVLRNMPESLADMKKPVLEAFTKFLDLLGMVQVKWL